MMVPDFAVEFDDGMPVEILDARDLPVAIDVFAAAIKRPWDVGDLTPDQRLLVWTAGTDGDVGSSLRCTVD
jgi:hypothetical protein